MQELREKVAVVTGAASGIGRALSARFAQLGMRVVMADVEAPTLEKAAQDVGSGVGEASQATVLPFVTDVSDAASVRALRDATLERFGRVDIVCNNAGVGGGARPTWKHTEHDWAWVLGVNLWGVIHGINTFLPDLMAQDEGHIVNTASIAGLISMPNLAAYNVSKHGVVTLSETLFSELAAKGSQVGISVLCPGAVNTRIHESGRNRPVAMKNPARQRSEAERKRAEEARQRVGEILAAGLAPDAVAEQVVEAIRNRRFYVLTHPEIKPAIEQRIGGMLTGKNPGSST